MFDKLAFTMFVSRHGGWGRNQCRILCVPLFVRDKQVVCVKEKDCVCTPAIDSCIVWLFTEGLSWSWYFFRGATNMSNNIQQSPLSFQRSVIVTLYLRRRRRSSICSVPRGRERHLGGEHPRSCPELCNTPAAKTWVPHTNAHAHMQ